MHLCKVWDEPGPPVLPFTRNSSVGRARQQLVGDVKDPQHCLIGLGGLIPGVCVFLMLDAGPL